MGTSKKERLAELAANVIEPEGRQEPTKKQAEQLDANRAAQLKIINDEEQDNFYNEELRELERAEQAIEGALSFYTDNQKSHTKLIFFLGHNGELESHAVDLHKSKSSVQNTPKPDYSGKLVDALHKIKTLAVREAVANDPALAFDILLQTLLQQLVHQGDSYSLPLSIRPDAKAVEVDEGLMAQSEIRSVQEVSAGDIKALSDESDLSTIRAMDSEVKQRLFAYLIASQIDAGGCYSGDGVSQMDEIVCAAEIDMRVKWQPPVAFFERVSKPTLLKILSEQCGESAADNCAGMKKADLALVMADRLAGKNWLPPAMMIAAPVEKKELDKVV